MATNTSRLGLLKKDTATDGNDTFNIKTMLNDNWDKIDAKVATLGPDGKVPADQVNIPALADASTTQKGVVQLEDSVSSTSTTKASTANSVKMVNDALTSHKADLVSQDIGKGASLIGINDSANQFTATTVEGALSELFTSVSNGKSTVANAITQKGQTASGSDTFAQLATAIGAINTGLKVKTGVATVSSTTGNFQYVGNTTTVNKNYISVTGLEFEPKYVIIYSTISTEFRLSLYIKDPLDAIYSGPTVKLSLYDVDIISTTSNNLKGNAGTASVNATSFVLPVDNNSNSQVNWIAIG